jgi:FkbM family methyltransferase
MNFKTLSKVTRLKIYYVKILKKLGLLVKFNFLLKRTFNEAKIVIPFIHGIGLTNLILEGDWIDLLIQSFVSNDNKTFVDVGVNKGQTLLRLKTKYSEVKYIGFEPNSTCVSYALKLIKLNNYKSCTIYNVALSSNVENLVLEKNEDEDPRASLISELRPNFFSDKLNVFAIDYQSFFIEEEISFVKIDVEGAEYEVLKGMEKAIVRYRPVIVCEVLDSYSGEVLDFTQKKASRVCKFLESLDYGIIQLQKNSNNGKISNFQKLENIRVKQWTKESYFFNDYLFYPKNQEKVVSGKLATLI